MIVCTLEHPLHIGNALVQMLRWVWRGARWGSIYWIADEKKDLVVTRKVDVATVLMGIYFSFLFHRNFCSLEAITTCKLNGSHVF